MLSKIIRFYSPEDRPAVFRIAADTAFFGEPVERFLEDRSLFVEAFYAYYTDFEPSHAWVCCIDQNVVGFLMGCIDTTAQRRRWLRVILPGVARRLVSGRYRIGNLTWQYVARMVRAAVLKELPQLVPSCRPNGGKSLLWF